MWPFHRHQWRLIQVNRGQAFVALDDGQQVETGAVTEVLQRCNSGRVRTEQLTGHWTLAELAGGQR